MLTLNPLQLTGRTRSHVIELADPVCSLHRQAAAAFQAMRAAAARDGIELKPVSSFRNFARQLGIWNAKFSGVRPLLDRQGVALDARLLAEDELIDAILIWSALPGASRHHWGSDLDVIDGAAERARRQKHPKWQPQLLPAEFAARAVFARLDAWLRRHQSEFGFFRPYEFDLGGVQPEPWHLSYAPVASPALAALTVENLRAALSGSELAGLQTVLGRLPQIVERYVHRVSVAI
jgi:LAS superfamily LD-carboxypeptidase LdcB